MSITLEDSKRTAIACKLAGIKEFQKLLISNEEKLISASSDQDVSHRLTSMLDDDKKNLGVLDTIIVQYGVKGEPKESVMTMVEEITKLMDGSELSLYEKVTKHESLKHEQFMAGYLLHKAAQVIGADVEAALTPLNTVNFENRAHEEQLKGVIELVGVRELTGQEPKQGLWARVQDSVAAFSGVVGSVVTQNSDKSDMNIQDVIRMDHSKVSILFTEIENSNDPKKIEEYFAQIYKDLSVHSEAEEQVVYPAVRPFYGDTQELYDEQAEMKTMLEEIKSMNPSDSNFKAKVAMLKNAVEEHVRQEENDMFMAIRNNCSDDQREQLATQFKQAKMQLQEKMAATAS
jgi:hemerythrin superfamily protein